jgi:AraC-like DNA-binding protein
MREPPLRILRRESDLGCWELGIGQPDSRLRGIVHRYEGYAESASPAPVLRQEVPSLHVPLIVNFGSRWRVATSGSTPEFRDSFFAGLFERSAFVEADGPASCVQIDFTPIGAHLFLGIPMHELSNRVLEAEDVLGGGRELVERLETARGWDARFALLDAVILRRLEGARRPAPEILWAWRALEQTDGALRIGALADRIGRSRKHLLAGFRTHVGLGPKTVARVMRFNRAVSALRRGPPQLAELAAECGYFDQAHLNREFREFAGTTPVEFARRLMPDGGVLGSA